MRTGPLCVVSLALAAACTRNPYVIGSVCPTGAADGAAVDPRCAVTPVPGSGTLVVDFKRSGASQLGPLRLASGTVQPTLWLRGERATATVWPAEGGGMLTRDAGRASPGADVPFNDGTGAVELGDTVSAYAGFGNALGEVGADDFALEVVLRAAPGATVFSKHAPGVGWSLHTVATRQLALDLEDAGGVTSLVSAPLVTGAWYHCLFWVSRAAGGRVDCDGREGSVTALPLGSLAATSVPLTAGGGADVRVAHLALFRVRPGDLGDPAGWRAESARRFFTLAGAYPSAAGGTPLPAPGLRDQPAYLDMEWAGLRRLFLVGEDWPRVACRGDVCGYLSEPARTANVPGDPSAWQANGVMVAPSALPFPDGEPRFVTVAPSTATTRHTLVAASTAGSKNQVFSFFVHRLSALRVGARGGNFGTAVFDIDAGTTRASPPDVTATIESWGSGIFRCSYAVRKAPGPLTYEVVLVSGDADSETFSGGGAATLEVARPQVDDGLVFAGSPFDGTTQEADRLTFVADDGNFPTGAAGAVDVGLLLPAGARITDQAVINVNRDGTYEDQVQLYVVGEPAADAGRAKFWRLEGGATHWSFDGARGVVDGLPHQLEARWGATTASLAVDHQPAETAAQIANAPGFGLNRIDVGFSQLSSGALEGLVTALRIGAM